MKKFLWLVTLVLFLITTIIYVSTKISNKVYAQTISTTFAPTADAYVYEPQPTTNFGSNASIAVDGSPAKRAYLKFELNNLSDTVTNATLRVYAASSQSTGYEVHALSDNSWSENTINYQNAPAFSPAISGVSGSVAANTWTSVDVTPLVSGNGTLSFVLLTTNSTNLNLQSRNSVNPPQLIIETSTEVTPSPTPSPTLAPTSTPQPTSTPLPTTVTIAAVGDMVCGATSSGGECKQLQVSDLILGMGVDAFLPLGDIQYESGEYSDFLNFYNPTYGRLNNIVRPAIGNHEYNDPTTTDPTQIGYWNYYNGLGNFSGIAGDRDKGYYSFNLGNWHIIALNSNCTKIGGCGAGSAQETWLRSDLAANTQTCTLAYYHHPLFSSGGRATTASKALWKALQDYDADVVLTGHDHTYERFAYQSSDGILDPNGIRQFVVGTGGRNLTSLASPANNSEVFDDTSFGALKITLTSTGYSWDFQPIPGDTFSDSGSNFCHKSEIVPTVTPTPTATSIPTVTHTPTTTPAPTSTSTSTPSPTATSTPQVLILNPTADAYVYESQSTTNFGSNVAIGVDASPIKRSYLKFNLSGLNSPISKATLKIYANSSQSAGYDVHSLSDNNWLENTINFLNAPIFSQTIAGSSGAVTAGSWISVDVTSLVTSNSELSLVLTTNSITNLSLASRNSVNPPQLIIEQ